MSRFLPLLCFVYLLFSCGSDDIPEPVETKPNYFPDSVGSKWVYRNADGHEWTREIASKKDTQDNIYQNFNYTPINLDTEIDILRPTSLRVTQNNILLDVSDKINQYIRTELPKSVQDNFVGLDIDVVTEPISYSELDYLRLPLTTNLHWEALDVKAQGNLILQDLTLLLIPFEVHINIKAGVLSQSQIETPVDSFNDTYQIEYHIESTYKVFSDEVSSKHGQTIWFTPHVGIVKIMNNSGVSELIDFTLK